jgi:hypothetical protein
LLETTAQFFPVTLATIYSPIGTAKVSSVDPEAWLHRVLGHIADHRANRDDQLLS